MNGDPIVIQEAGWYRISVGYNTTKPVSLFGANAFQPASVEVVKVDSTDDEDEPPPVGKQPCLCGDDDPEGCMYLIAGYPYCRPCAEHHRGNECAVDDEGYALEWCGCRWVDLVGPESVGHSCDTLDEEP